MKKKRITQKEIGFIQGIMYSAALLKSHSVDARNLLRESGYSIQQLRKYAGEDLEYLQEELDRLETEYNRER